MSTQKNKLLIRDYIEKVINTGDTARMEDYIHPEYAEVYQGQRYELGISGAAKHILGVRQTYPDLRLDIQHQIAEGDWVATMYTMTGTHDGAWLGIKPTHKKIQTTGVNVDRLLRGKIIEHGGAANLFDALLAVGAISLVTG